MTDIHSHILFSVDDGSNNIDESMKLLKAMKKIGFDNIILTPHYIQNTDYQCDNHEKKEKLDILKQTLKQNNLEVNVYLGNEIYINDQIPELINSNEIHSLNSSKYLLIEFPFHNKILNLEDIIYDIKYHGYIPIIAHPERYLYFQKNYDLVKKLKADGILFQSNYSCILGEYGMASKKLFKKLLKDKYVDYLGTDIHHTNQIGMLDKFDKMVKKIKKITGEDYYQKILSNSDSLIEDSCKSI